METPEQVLLRAEARLLSSDAPTMVEAVDDDDDPTRLKQQLNALRIKLEGKSALCEKLQNALTRLMASERDTKREYDLTSEYLTATLALYQRQVWFSIKVPQVVDAVFNQLVTRVTNDINDSSRDRAFTHDECVELVEEQVRLAWEKNLPSTISNILCLNILVYSSHADQKNRNNGTKCEPIHFLVYLIRRLYNHITNYLFLRRQKHSREDKMEKSCTELDRFGRGKEEETKDEEKDGRLRWQDNPTCKEDFVELLKTSHEINKCILTAEECTQAVKASVTKLCSKPVLAEVTKHICSIVTLQHRAASQDWSIPRKSHFFFPTLIVNTSTR